MSIACPGCHHRNRRGARFCDQCGARLDAVVLPAKNERTVELRPATFLFCDLVQSTRLANELELEELRMVFRGFREVVAQVTRQHNGYLMRFVGDGAVVSFGYPEAREDAAESAVRTGLALVMSLRAAAPVPGLVLELRVGIASGTVVVGELIDESAIKEESVIGSVPHLAARLVAEAPRGGVLIADATRRLVGRYFDYQDAGALNLKGFDQPVRAWLVLGESSIASRFEAHRAAEAGAALVGRDGVLARMLSAWALARGGEGQVLVVTGEAGIGKSRLARAVRAQAQADQAVVIEIDCSARTSHTPLYPVSVLARRIAGLRLTDDAAARQQRVDRLLGRLFGAERIDAVRAYLGPLFGLAREGAALRESPEQVRDRSIGLLLEIVQRQAAAGPVLLLCEDLHWADATTLELLQRLAREVAGRPVLLLVTARTEPGQPPLAGFDGATPIEVAALPAVDARDVVENTAGRGVLPAEAIEAIVRRGEGVPLYLEELTRNLLESAQDGQPLGADLIAGRGIPATLQSVVQVRLDRWPRLKPILQAASVLGREFSLRLLEELLQAPRAELYDALARLVDHGVVLPRDGGSLASFRFRHALIHEAVYDTLLRSDRENLHSRAANVLVQHFDGLPEAARDVLAHHLAAAKRYEEAVTCLVAASEEMAARAAYLESIGHSRGGLALIGKIGDPRLQRQLRLQLLTQLGVALSATRGYAMPEVETTYREARLLCDDDADPVALFPIVRGLGTFYFVRCDLNNADEVSTQCIRLARQADRTDHLIEAMSFRGYTRLYLGHVAQARAALEECTALYRRHEGMRFRYPSPQDAGTAAWSLLGTAAWLEGDTAAAEQAVSDVLAHAEAIGRPFDKAYAHVWVAMLRNLQRRYDDAEAHANTCVAISSLHGFTTWLVAATMQNCIAQAARGAALEAVQVLRGTLQAFIQAGAEANVPYFLLGAARGLRHLGDLAEARSLLAEAGQRAEATGETYLKSELLMLEAELEPDAERAAALLYEALDLATRQGARVLALRAALMLRAQPGAGANGGANGDADRAVAGHTPAQAQLWKALEGLAPYPERGDWVGEALAELLPALPARRPVMVAG